MSTRTTNAQLDHICSCINSMLDNGTRYGVYQAYGHIDIVFYRDPNSSGCSDVACGLTKSGAYDVLQGVYHAISNLKCASK